MGAVGALVLAALNRRLTMTMIYTGLDTTAKLSSFVVFILLVCARLLADLYGVDGHIWVEHLLTASPGWRTGIPDRRQPAGLRARVLPRFLRAGVHHRPAAGSSCGKASASISSGSRAAGRQHADVVHASAVRIRAVLPALGGARKPYVDKVTNQTIAPVTTGQIYLGSIPYVIIQLIMVGIVIAFPILVTHYKSDSIAVDPSTIRIDVPMRGRGRAATRSATPAIRSASPRRKRARCHAAAAGLRRSGPGGARRPAATDFGAPPAAPAAPGGLPPPDFGAPAQ